MQAISSIRTTVDDHTYSSAILAGYLTRVRSNIPIYCAQEVMACYADAAKAGVKSNGDHALFSSAGNHGDNG